MRTTLEEERRTLLEQIEASRGVYRRLLNGETDDTQTTPAHRVTVKRPARSIRQQLGQWAADHPLQIAAGVTLLVWLGPGLIRRIQSRPKASAKASVPSPRTGTAKAIATALVLLLRDPRRLQMTASVLTTAWRWLRRRTSTPTPPPGRKPYA
jgi:hypothetical protein